MENCEKSTIEEKIKKIKNYTLMSELERSNNEKIFKSIVSNILKMSESTISDNCKMFNSITSNIIHNTFFFKLGKSYKKYKK